MAVTAFPDRPRPMAAMPAGMAAAAQPTRPVSTRLTVHPLKSAVDRPHKRKFLRFTVSRTEANWIQEAGRQMAEVESGTVSFIPGEEAMSRLRARLMQ